MARNYTLTQTGAEVQSDLYKIEGAKIEGGTITIDGVSITPVTEETDPTVPDWAKTPTKPAYTAEEVGALPADTALAELPTDSDHRTVSDAEKAAWNAKSDFSGDYRDLTHQPDLSQFVTRTVNNLLYYYRKGEVYNREEITQLLSTITTGVWQVVPELPVASEATYGMKIYLVPSSQPQSGNVKDEYITVKNGNVYSWEQIGSTAIDLSDYVTDEDLQDALEDYVSTEAFRQALSAKQDLLVSGRNIKTVNGESILGSGDIVAGDPNAVKYTEQTLTDAQKTQARTNIGAGTYSKPSGGIPGSDIAPGVIPDVSQFITKSVNDLANYYLKTETFTKDEVAALIGAIQQFHYEIVATLPATGEGNILYLLGPTGTGADKYEEYVYANSTWTKIGDTSIDLSGYVTTTALNTALANYWPKADVVNITLSDLAITGDWADIENNPIPEPSASDNGKVLGVTDAQGTLGWVQGGGGGSGSVTSVGLSVPTGLQVSGSPVTSSGTLAVSFQTGYSIPTDAKQSGWDAKYDKPSGGIPKTDLASGVQASLEKADSALQSFTEADPVFTASPAAGITASDITNWNGKQSAITDLADIRSGAAAGATAYQKPSTGIPASDIATGVIPSVESLTTAEIDTIWNNAA